MPEINSWKYDPQQSARHFIKKAQSGSLNEPAVLDEIVDVLEKTRSHFSTNHTLDLHKCLFAHGLSLHELLLRPRACVEVLSQQQPILDLYFAKLAKLDFSSLPLPLSFAYTAPQPASIRLLSLMDLSTANLCGKQYNGFSLMGVLLLTKRLDVLQFIIDKSHASGMEIPLASMNAGMPACNFLETLDKLQSPQEYRGFYRDMENAHDENASLVQLGKLREAVMAYSSTLAANRLKKGLLPRGKTASSIKL